MKDFLIHEVTRRHTKDLSLVPVSKWLKPYQSSFRCKPEATLFEEFRPPGFRQGDAVSKF